MSEVENLLTRARDLATKHQRELTTVSKWLFGDWRRLGEIEAGESFLRPPTLKAALERLTKLEEDGPPRKAKPQGASNGSEDQCAAQSGGEAEDPTQQRTRRSAGA